MVGPSPAARVSRAPDCGCREAAESRLGGELEKEVRVGAAVGGGRAVRIRGNRRCRWSEEVRVGASSSLSLVFKVSLFSLSFVIVRERAPESHSAGSVCHLRRRRPWCAVKRLLRFGARCALAMDSQDSC